STNDVTNLAEEIVARFVRQVHVGEVQAGRPAIGIDPSQILVPIVVWLLKEVYSQVKSSIASREKRHDVPRLSDEQLAAIQQTLKLKSQVLIHRGVLAEDHRQLLEDEILHVLRRNPEYLLGDRSKDT